MTFLSQLNTITYHFHYKCMKVHWMVIINIIIGNIGMCSNAFSILYCFNWWTINYFYKVSIYSSAINLFWIKCWSANSSDSVEPSGASASALAQCQHNCLINRQTSWGEFNSIASFFVMSLTTTEKNMLVEEKSVSNLVDKKICLRLLTGGGCLGQYYLEIILSDNYTIIIL